ncbi:hypothetical protein Tco_0809129 [Tanacetum coccineum]
MGSQFRMPGNNLTRLLLLVSWLHFCSWRPSLLPCYEVLEGFGRGDVVAARKEQQGGDVEVGGTRRIRGAW